MYKELRILTARPSAEEEATVPHRLYGLLPGHEACSAGKWLKFAKMEIDWALQNKQLPIVTGGTGLYVRALMEGIAEIPDIPVQVRQQATNDYEAMGKEAFCERLKAVDPEFFERLAVHDRQRLIRAYEVWLGTAKPLSWWQKQGMEAPYAKESFMVLQVDIPRETLYRRCDERFLSMLEQGAIEEVKQLISLDLPDDLPVMKSVGVREIRDHLQGEPLETCVSAAQQATRNFAKRQLTWFRNQMEAHKAGSPEALWNYIDENPPKH